MKLILFCGNLAPDGFYRVDIDKNVNPDLVYDLNELPLPFESNSIEEIDVDFGVHYVKDLISFFSELYRITKNNSKVSIKHRVGLIEDPLALRHFTSRSFLMLFSEKHNTGGKFYGNGLFNFKLISYENINEVSQEIILETIK